MKYILTLATVIIVSIIGFDIARPSIPVFGAVTNTSIAYLATTTQSLLVGPATTTTAFATRLNCASRIISTKGQAIMIGFQSSSTQTIGFWQSASTTVSYPSNQFGCGSWNITGLVASTTITTAEFIY